MPDEQRDETDSIILEPMSLCDVSRHRNIVRENSKDEGIDGLPPANPHLCFSAAMGTTAQRESKTAEQKRLRRLRAWRRAAMKARCLGDPWEKFHLDEYPTERAVRYRYNALRKSWVTDEVVIKMQPDPFSHGAMRECFRMKKLSNFSHNNDWRRDCNNYVAKRYMDNVDRDVYFQDVQLQMDAKLWGEEYNRHNPPKKVDIFQMAVLELVERENGPLYHIEHFIEGDYVKYNSNSGFVKEDHEHLRLTPQAFSHFTFERSGHELIIVDIQGVGDLYTDPQIHTASGEEYGEGNLGTRGMALFFHTHVCNRICKSLGLFPFDLAPSELNESDMKLLKKSQEKCTTVLRGHEEHCGAMPRNRLWGRIPRTLSEPISRPRTISESSGFQSITPPESPSGEIYSVSMEDIDEPANHHASLMFTISCPASDSDYDSVSNSESERSVVRRRHRLDSESGSVMNDDERLLFHNDIVRKNRPSCIQPPNPHDLEIVKNDSVLGMIHLQLCRYHELRRFTSPDSAWYDKDAALFHLEKAADCGVQEARLALAYMLMGLQHDILPDMELDRSIENEDKGFGLLLDAATAGDKESIVLVAKSYDTGTLLGKRSIDWDEALQWYEEAVSQGGTDQEPAYQLQARMAEMLRKGGPNLPKDPNRSGELYTEAAEAAMAAMKGRLATAWYESAEEAWAECEEEEEPENGEK